MIDKSIHIVGSAHLDPIWLWRWFDGYNEVMQTFRSALDRLNEYDHTVFTCSSASYYKWVENTDPDMFAEIQQRVKEGRWVIVNGWNVQPDCNMPSAESFARQALYSQLYYYDKFGKICTTGYNVDSFGHNGMLPQLLTKGGMRRYVMMRPGMHENPNIPQGAFWWKSADGSFVLTYRIKESYTANGTRSIDEHLKQETDFADEHGYPQMMFYGVGNHGGGPTKGDIEYITQKAKEDKSRKYHFSSPDKYFTSLCLTGTDLPVWDSEMQHHASGCYSSTSLVKQLNRKCENSLYTAETWDTLASLIKGRKAETAKFAEAWDTVCFNQFHDVLCGCSIREAYDDVKNSAGHAMTVADRIKIRSVVEIARGIDTWIDGISDTVTSEIRHLGIPREFPRPVVVFNPHSWDIEVPVRTLYPSVKVTDCDGNETGFSLVRSSRSNDSHIDTVFLAKVPAMGYATYFIHQNDCSDEDLRPVLDYKSIEGDTVDIENEYMSVSFDTKTGYIVSLVNKEDGRDFAAEHDLAVPVVIDDSVADTWAHNIFRFEDEMDEMKLVSIQLIENGGIRSVVRTKHDFHGSLFIQDFILTNTQRVLRVKCKALWKEQFTMLKTEFDIGGKDEVSTAQIPAGFISRIPNGDEEPCQQWTDISSYDENGGFGGIAIINDSKYSYSCKGTQLRQTLMRNVIFADHYSYRPETEYNFTDEGVQYFEYGIYPHTGKAELSDVTREAALFNNAPFTIQEGCHKGCGRPQKASFIKIDADNVIVTAFKECEDGSGAHIVRLYETKGIEETRAVLMCDLLDCGIKFDIHNNEILTFRIEKDGSAKIVNFLEGTV